MINYDIEAQYSFESNMSDGDLDNQIAGIKKAVEDYLEADLRALLDYEDIAITVKIDPDLSEESHNEEGSVKISISNSSSIEGIEQELNAFTFTYGGSVEDEEVPELDIVVDVNYWNYDIFKFRLLNTLEESKNNELDKMAKFNNKHDKGQGYFVKLNAGNVPLNNSTFNQGVGITEDMNKEKVTLEYENLSVGNDYIDWNLEVDKDIVEDYLGDLIADWEQFDYDEPQRSRDINKYVHDHFDELLDNYYDQVLDYFEDWAREDAEDNYEEYDSRDDYEEYDDVNLNESSVNEDYWDSAIDSTYDKEKRKELTKKKEYYHWYDIINVYITDLISAKMHEFDIKWDMYLNEEDRQDLLKMLEDKMHKIIDNYSPEQLEETKEDINLTKYLNNKGKKELISFIEATTKNADVEDESINIKEALNRIDSQTYCEYDLLNSYNSIKWDVNKKNRLIEKLNKRSSAKELNRFFESLINEEDDEDIPNQVEKIKLKRKYK